MEPGQPHNANTTGQPQVPSPAAQAPRVAFFRPPQSQSRRGRRSNLALASVLLGLGSLSVVTLELVVPFLGVISWGMAVAGGSLGIVALKGIKRSGKRLRGVGSAGGSELLPEESAGKQGYVIGFLNGYVEAVPKDQLSDLIWIPQNK